MPTMCQAESWGWSKQEGRRGFPVQEVHIQIMCVFMGACYVCECICMCVDGGGKLITTKETKINNI